MSSTLVSVKALQRTGDFSLPVARVYNTKMDVYNGAGRLVESARLSRGMTLDSLAGLLGMTSGELSDIENGRASNGSLDIATLDRVGQLFSSSDPLLDPYSGYHLRVRGGGQLTGSISVNSSKNSSVGLLCASLLNHGITRLKNVARIEEVKRICEVLESLGVEITTSNDGSDMTLVRPSVLEFSSIDEVSAKRTRSILMFLGPLVGDDRSYDLPYAGGCDLGTRTIEPHLIALRPFGVSVVASDGMYHVSLGEAEKRVSRRVIVLTERGDTVTENAIMAAALVESVTVIKNASCNYAIQDLCYMLSDMGVRIDGVGTTSLEIHGVSSIDVDVTYTVSEDPIEAMSLVAAAIVTSSSLQIRRVPIEFMEIELAILSEMGLQYELSSEYMSYNGRTRLVDLSVIPSQLSAPMDKIHPMPFPGLNIDNLPFFALIAATASGPTLIHDWVYETRSLYLTELSRLGADVTLLDPHRVRVEGPTHWSGADMMCPPALRPAVVLLLAMLACKGTSTLRNVYVINRGYEDIARRLNEVGAQIEVFSG